MIQAGSFPLWQIQDDLYNRVNRGAKDQPQPVQITKLDDSIQFHSCHGRIRQLEVLRDALLRLFRDDKTIEPRDVVVICPDIEGYAPLIDAVFSDGMRQGQGQGRGQGRGQGQGQGQGFQDSVQHY